MALDNSLPFERGFTWKDGNTAQTNVPNVHCIGASYPTTDGEAGGPVPTGETFLTKGVIGGHRTGRNIELQAIVNLAGQTLSLTRRGLRGSTLNSASPAYAVNTGGSSGALTTYLPDDAYKSGHSIAAGDVFYVVRKGPCLARVSVTAGNIGIGDGLRWQTSGNLRKAGTATTNSYIVARALQAATTNNVQKLVEML